MMRLLRSYLFWTYERGSLHYDIMVTLILAFLFLAPRFIDFHDRPLPEIPARAQEVLVRTVSSPDHRPRFIYEIRVDDLRGVTSEAELHARIAAQITTIAGNVTIDSIQPLKDPRGRTVAFDATVHRAP